MKPEQEYTYRATRHDRVYQHGAEVAGLAVEQFGPFPTALFVAGLHGDEAGIIEPLYTMLDTFTGTGIGDHIRVMQANPEAVKRATRTVDGVDLNRQFIDAVSVDHPQAKLLADTIRTHQDVYTVFSFHEDRDQDGFYMYYHPFDADFGQNDQLILNLKDRLCGAIKDAGFGTFSGIDDPGLQNTVVDGFIAYPADGVPDKTFEMWAANAKGNGHPHMRRSFVFEVPSSMTPERKQEMLHIVFETFILPYLAKNERGD